MTAASSSLQKAADHIRKRWKEGRSLKEIADIYNVDPGNLARSFRNAEHMTVKEYSDAMRKSHVIAELRRNHAVGYEIGSALGFLNDLSFYRWVRRVFGIPFRQVRQHYVPGQDPPRPQSGMTRKRYKK